MANTETAFIAHDFALALPVQPVQEKTGVGTIAPIRESFETRTPT